MPNSNLTLIQVILDKSGSMSHLVDATLEGLNSFLNEQRNVSGEARFGLVQFGSGVYVTHDYVDLKDVPVLTKEDYVPNGWTAMYDAIGTTIDSVGNKLAAMPEAERPGRVVFVIQTDGKENFSQRYNLSMIKNRIEHQRNKYQWQFIFLGANQDAVLAGETIGILGGTSLTYNANVLSTRAVFANASSNIGSYRVGGQSVNSFTEAQRAEVVKNSDK